MMLRNVLDDFLSRATERQLDLPLLLLLPAMGFHDAHLIHGTEEFGKDLIAKRWEDGADIQYVLQSKAGDIGQAEWRVIQHQILEAAVNTLGHPNFDATLPRQTVLVASGELSGNALLGLQNLNEGLLQDLGRRPVIFWDRQNLLERFLQFGLSGIHRVTADGFTEHAQFFLAYAEAVRGTLSDRDIEAYSRQWMDALVDLDRRLLRSAIEAEVLSQQCAAHGHYHEAIQAHLALLRALCAASYTDPADRLAVAFGEGVARLHDLCRGYLGEIRKAWTEERNLLRIAPGSFEMTTYLVHCARIVEVASVAYFTTPDAETRAECVAFLEDFVRHEPGCSHPLSDRSAVALVLAVLALCDGGWEVLVRDLLRRATVWVCDRYQYGLGLAGLEADELEETKTLLGYAFDFIDLPEPRSSFLATALGDLAAFVGDHDLYRAVVNDIKACRVHPQYWQPRDSVGACSVEGEDVVGYPSVSYEDDLTEFAAYAFANHLADEHAMFRFVDSFGPVSAVALMALLRDRYFPKLWALLTPGRQERMPASA